MCVCLCMFICCVCLCIFVYVCVYLYICVCLCMFMFVYVCVWFVYVCMFMFVYVCMFMFVYVCMFIFVYVCMFIQFSYSSLIWMFHSRMLNNRINNLHERTLRLVYKDNSSSFAQLLERDKSFSIHSRNLQKLAIEMFKVKNNLSPSFMHSIFPATENNYNFRNTPEFKMENIRTTLYGSETLMHRDQKHGTLFHKK